ncbi:MAG: hypothetical protein HYR56_03615 [Acidobacteria bacterium]|nr:hypothetical protein [Acidobacteriota bacterium]MBI3427010.1 hypothetical protein [Acidobacteriota bacterium]
MNAVQHQFSIVVSEQRCIATAWRNDRVWGHAIDIEIADKAGRLLNRVVFACHPEFGEFDLFQAKTTTQLIGIAREMLESGRYEEELLKASANHLELLIRLNNSD